MALTEVEAIFIDVLDSIPDGRGPSRRQCAELKEMRPRADDADVVRIDTLLGRSTAAALTRGAERAGGNGVESDMIRETQGRPKTDPKGRPTAATARMFDRSDQVVS